jgi:glycosyltransferase involved in cell wall biosynthesis
MYRRLGDDFHFVSTTVMREERKKLGYSHDDSPSYVIHTYKSEYQKNKAIELINGADVVIAGSAPNELLLERIRQNRLLFRYSERIYKKPASFLRRAYHFYKLRRNDLFKKNIYMLCAGAYAASDFASLGMYKNRMYKWGYFPETKEYDIDKLLSQKKKNTLMWCGRFIDWKHPDDAIELARRLKENGYDFSLNMVGTGIMEEELKALVLEYGLEDQVHFLGSMPPETVREYMEESEIFLFTSDRQEGWGAVLNEAMNSGCAVVASDEIGSVSYLIKESTNGIIYESGNIDMLYEKTKYLFDNYNEAFRMRVSAYTTITEEWNAVVATDRLHDLVSCILLAKNENVYTSGPCSVVESISNMELLK